MKKSHIHCIGIGGCGVGAVAQILYEMGHTVTGSDLNSNFVTDYLKKLGMKIYHDHKAENISENINIIVATGAAKQTNPEIIRAKELNIPVLHRADMLAEILKNNSGIAISGAHGKTSTTGLIASIFNYDNNLKFAIGSSYGKIMTGAQYGNSQYMVIEADESDASFIKYDPKIVLITNIDADHMDFFQNYNNLEKSYLDFIYKTPENTGKVFLCLDDDNIKNIITKIQIKIY